MGQHIPMSAKGDLVTGLSIAEWFVVAVVEVVVAETPACGRPRFDCRHCFPSAWLPQAPWGPEKERTDKKKN